MSRLTSHAAAFVLLAIPFLFCSSAGAGDVKYDTYQPSIVGSCATTGSFRDIAISGDYAYIGNQVIDISDPTAPVLVGTYSYEYCDYTNVSSVSGDYLYGHGAMRLVVVDISDPAHPVHVGTDYSMGYTRGVVTSGDCAFLVHDGSYVTEDQPGFEVFDITDPTAPDYVCAYPGIIGISNICIAISGRHLFVGSAASVSIYDAGNPFNLVYSGRIPRAGVEDIAFSGNHALVVGQDCGLQIFDITDPAEATLVAVLPMSAHPCRVVVSGNHAYVSDFDYGLRMVDISDPWNPVLVGECSTPGNACGIAVSGDFVFVVDRETSLQVIAIGEPVSAVPDASAGFLLHQNVPNPFNPATTIRFELREATPVELRVFDVTGRHVRTLLDRRWIDAGNHEVAWSGRNTAGRAVAAGVYFYRLSAGSYSETKWMTLVK